MRNASNASSSRPWASLLLTAGLLGASGLVLGSLAFDGHGSALAQPPSERGQAIDVEAGTRLGPIRIGMTEAEVRALGLPESARDARSRRFGPYRVFFDGRGVRRVEAQMGDLGRIRVGGAVFDAGTHIHRLRDAFGSCEWQEGGGERYRCASGTLFVQTTHSMDPARYTVAVERR